MPNVPADCAIVRLPMGKSADLDPETIARIAAHLRRKMHELEVSKRGLARQIGITSQHLVKILKGSRNVGTGVLVKIHRNLHIDLNQLIDIDPPRRFFGPPDDDGPRIKSVASR